MWRKHILAVSFVLIACLSSSVWGGLIGHWALDEGSGTTARDSSGGNNHGRFVSAPLWVDGVFGKALDFDGVDDYVEIPHNARLIPTTGKATVSVWINAARHTGPGGSQWQGILAKGGAPRLYNLYTEASQVLHFSTGPSGAYIGPLSTGTVPLNEWVHVAVVVDGRDYFYINGDPAGVGGEGATVPTGGTAPLTIGQTGESNFFQGMIDDVRLYDRALTAEQVKGLFGGVPPVFGKAEGPNPANGTIGVTMPLLQWTAGEKALFHNVYLGTSPELTEANLVGPRLTFLMYYHTMGLTSGTTYYWRVDEVQADGTTTTGDVWSFTAAPTTAYAADPPDGARSVLLDSKLTWSAGSTAISHDVYFGTNRDDVAAGTGDTFKGNRTTATFDPGALTGDTTYYWRVDEIGTTGAKEVGNVWSFRTLPEISITDPNLVGWWKLDETSGTVVIDWSGYGNHGTLRGDPERVPGYDGGALKLNGVNQYAEIPHDATLTADSEVTVMAWINTERHTGPGGQEWQGIIAKGNSPRSYSFYTYAPGTLHFSSAVGGGTSTGIVPLNEWVHVAVAAGPGGHTYFINGESAGTGGAVTPPGAQDTATVLIGNTQEDGRELLGMIDDARIYNVALTQEQIQEAMRGDPLLAWGPVPTDGSVVDVGGAASLGWQPGDAASQHDVYFGTDAAAVADAETTSPEYQGRQAATSYPLTGRVEFGGGTYFWRIDDVEADAVTIHKGRLWSFTVADYLIVDDFEGYTDELTGRIFQTWLDGWGYTEPEVVEGNGTGSTVGYLDPPYAETQIVHSGRQSMPFDYNNIIPPHYSEAERLWAAPQNWTLNGVDTLTLWIRGNPARSTVNETSPGAFSVTGEGADIWDSADQFTYVYKTLNGDGSLVARVVSNGTGSNTWAKGGAMIRDTLAAGSTHCMQVMTGSAGNGASLQWRPVVDDVSSNSDALAAVAPPYWVKIERVGNSITGSLSPNGTTWTQQGVSQVIFMTNPCCIGLCVTSHAAGENRTFEFDNVKTTGSVTGQWQARDIGLTRNDPATLYVVVQDSANRIKDVPNPDPGMVNVTDWTEWPIALSAFSGVDMTRVKKMFIGVGNRNAPTPDGAGMLYIDDIRVVKPAPPEPDDVIVE